MTCSYRRKRIPSLPAEATRALDDEFAAIERVAECLFTAAGGTDLSIANAGASTLDIASSSGEDVTLPAATPTTAGLATASQVAALAAAVPGTRQVATANGLQGGGVLSADLSLSPVYGSVAGTVCQGNDPRLGGSATGATDLGIANITASTLTITSSTGAGAVVPAATDVAAGVVSYGNVAGRACQGNDARLHSPFRVVNGSEVIQGVLAEVVGGGLAVVATDSAGVWQAGYGGIELHPGSTRVVGTSVKIDTLIGTGSRMVLTAADGTLSAGTLPAGTNLSVTGITTTGLTVASSTGDDAAIPAATISAAGLATAAQITTLNAAVPNSRQVATANGLQGGGNLVGNLSLSPVYGNGAGTICEGNDARLNASSGVQYKGHWLAGTTYNRDDIAIDGPWLCIARATTTTARPGVVGVLTPVWVYATDPAWVQANLSRYIGTRYVLAQSIMVYGVRFRSDIAGRTITNAYIAVNGVKLFTVAQNLVTVAGWNEIRFAPFPLVAGATMDLAMSITGGYVYSLNYFSVGGTVHSFISTTDNYPPTVFNEDAYGLDVLYANNTQSPDWEIMCKTA